MLRFSVLALSVLLFASVAHAELGKRSTFTEYAPAGGWVCRCFCKAHFGYDIDIPDGKCDGTEEGSGCETTSGPGVNHEGEFENCRDVYVNGTPAEHYLLGY